MDASITLTKDEYDAAAALGVKREALRRARQKARPVPGDGGGDWDDRNAIGAVAEYALAKLLGPAFVRDWVETKAYSENHRAIACDVGDNLHVRATTRANGNLILHPGDPDNGAFVLARVDGRTVTFPGWCRAGACKTDEYWRDTGPGFGKRPAYVVPARELLPMDALRPGDKACTSND